MSAKNERLLKKMLAKKTTRHFKKKFRETFPQPWELDWDDGPPRIFAANGRCVCVLPTGTLEGAYNSEVIVELGKVLLGMEKF